MTTPTSRTETFLRVDWKGLYPTDLGTNIISNEGLVTHQEGVSTRLNFFEFTSPKIFNALFRVKVPNLCGSDSELPLKIGIIKPKEEIESDRLVLTSEQIQNLRLKAVFFRENPLKDFSVMDPEPDRLTVNKIEREIEIQMGEVIIPGQTYCITLSSEGFELRAALSHDQARSFCKTGIISYDSFMEKIREESKTQADIRFAHNFGFVVKKMKDAGVLDPLIITTSVEFYNYLFAFGPSIVELNHDDMSEVFKAPTKEILADNISVLFLIVLWRMGKSKLEALIKTVNSLTEKHAESTVSPSLKKEILEIFFRWIGQERGLKDVMTSILNSYFKEGRMSTKAVDLIYESIDTFLGKYKRAME